MLPSFPCLPPPPDAVQPSEMTYRTVLWTLTGNSVNLRVASIITNATVKLLTEQGAQYRMQKTSDKHASQQTPAVGCWANALTLLFPDQKTGDHTPYLSTARVPVNSKWGKTCGHTSQTVKGQSGTNGFEYNHCHNQSVWTFSFLSNHPKYLEGIYLFLGKAKVMRL